MSFKFSIRDRRRGPISETVVRIGCPCSPNKSQKITDDAAKGIDSIFKFLNIISFEKDINISLAESTISKAIMAYLIYQFVISLRKDTRK